MTLCDFIDNYTHHDAEVLVFAEVQIIITAECNPVYSYLYTDGVHIELKRSSSVITVHKVHIR